MREPELQSAVSKVKWRILPLFVVMFIVNYIDRVNISFIKEQLHTDLGLNAEAFGLEHHGNGCQNVAIVVNESDSISHVTSLSGKGSECRNACGAPQVLTRVITRG